MLVEAAWAAAKAPGPLHAFFVRIRARKGHQVAAVAVARARGFVLASAHQKRGLSLGAPDPRRQESSRHGARKRSIGKERPQGRHICTDGARVLTSARLAHLWDISTLPPRSILDIACAWLRDHDLSDLGKDYSLDLAYEASICRMDANGKFATPPPDPTRAK